MLVMTWKEVFNEIKEKDYAKELAAFLDEEYSKYVIYPKRENMYNAFAYTPLKEVKVVIFGQDPYHEPGQAMGLCFSVPDNIKVPPSLINIYKEIENEYHKQFINHSGDLTYLAKQGVLLLNTVLTVREHQPLSHDNSLYAEFTKDIVLALEKCDQPIAYLLWGNNAKKMMKYITNKNHLVLTACHPSPLAANHGGWFGNNHFIKTNEFLVKNGINPINWLK
ncbi:MAG: uracil-DNA glycosylase [Bacilli bacterium]|nr:uracil-DNA glycosylase [Bacilli bacterium]